MMNNLLELAGTMYLFDNLPLEIIKYEIIPYLNYYERMAVNISLPPQDRISTPLTLPDIVVKKRKAVSNVKDPYWSTVEAPHIVEYPRARRGNELREITFAEMITQEQVMQIQLRHGQRKIHQAIKEGIFEREPGPPMKCKCCATL
jgi:hypothetical protein